MKYAALTAKLAFSIVVTILLMNIANANIDFNDIGVPIITAPIPNSQSIPAVTHNTADKEQASPVQFAVNSDISLNTQNAGLWDFPTVHTARWRLLVRSANAVNMSLHFGHLHLPPTAKLYIADANNLNRHGPFDQTQNQLGEFWSPLVTGDTIYIEVTLAAHEQAALNLQLKRVNHGFKSIDKAGAQHQNSNHTSSARSGQCNIDTSCAIADPYADQTRAVARLIIDGRFLCTGTLMNNTSSDARPYLLTARHCFNGSGEFDANQAKTVTVNWNYENSGCNDDIQDARTTDTQSGTILRAEWDDTDMMLLELLTPPPTDYQVHYAGWDRRNLNFVSSATLHHPHGNPKQASFSNNATKATGRFSNRSGDQHYLQVEWSEGTTDSGSSGAALLSPQGLVVGQLLGGYASCETPAEKDWYGRLHNSWIGGGTATTGLQNWLDPVQSGHMVLDGIDYVQSDASQENNSMRTAHSETDISESSAPSTATPENNNGGGGTISWLLLMLLFGLVSLASSRHMATLAD